MQVPFSSILGRLLGVVLLAMSPGILGCDTVPAPEEPQPPSVAGLQVVPDSIHQSDLSSDQVRDSMAQDTLTIGVQASDPDGSVARVVFVLEPSSNPRGAISGQLPAQSQSASLHRGQLGLSLPLVDEIYTIRVFAVDDDSLASNQVTGQLRFVATDSSSTSAALTLSK
jgi:hypothetical protein